MRFELTSDQRDFGAAIDGLLTASDTVSVARAWADDDTGPGLALWARLAEQGVQALLVPEDAGGTGATTVELAVVFELLGRHAVPGPWVESVAYLPAALTGTDDADDAAVVGALAEGAVGTVGVHGLALDADIADHVYALTPELVAAEAGARRHSVDRTRRLFEVPGAAEPAHDAAFDLAVLAVSAQLLGAGERVLADSVAYVKQRRQFGREIGSYQAIKHALADVRITLDFARPLVFAAALGEISPSAAKVACSDAAYRASRTGLQVHGAIGYTAELDLSVWLTKIRALVSAWGTPGAHRARLLESLVVPSATSGSR